MKAVLFVLMLTMLCGTASAWSISGWDNHTELQIDNTGGSSLEYYQVYVDLTGNPINSTSLRVVNETGGAFVPHWQETISAGNCTKLWFNATTIPTSSWLNGTYYVYYTNVSASSTSDGNTTFPFFDEFHRANSDTVGNGWVEASNIGLITDNMLNLTPPDNAGYYDALYKDGAFEDVLIEMFINFSDLARYPPESEGLYWNVFGNGANERFSLFIGAGTGINYLNPSSDWVWTGHNITFYVPQYMGMRYNSVAGTFDVYHQRIRINDNIGTAASTTTDRVTYGLSALEDESQYIDFVLTRKCVYPEPNAVLNISEEWAAMTISSPSPGIADLRYISNRTVTYSATPSMTADCKWEYTNGTFIEWDNSTTSPTMVRWINSSSIVAFDISLTAYETGNTSNHASETWSNPIMDDVFDYTNYTWERLEVWNDKMFTGCGGNLEFGDVDNDGSDELIIVESPTYANCAKDIVIYEMDGSSKTYTDVTSNTGIWIEASVHDVDQDGINELFCMYSNPLDARADVFRFDTTHLIGSNMNKDIMESGSNNPKSFSWINISNQEHFYVVGCGSGETTDVFLNLTSFSTHEIDDFSISGEGNLAWDIDGDGDLELLVIEGYSANSAKVWLYELNYDTGAYTSKTMLFDNDLKSAHHYTAAMMTGDVDNDGIDNLIIFWTPTSDPDLRISEVEAYEFDGIVHFGEGNYSEGFAISSCDNWEFGVSCGAGKHFIGDIDNDGLNEFVAGHYVPTTLYDYNTIVWVYDIPSGGSGISKYKLADFDPDYLDGTTHQIHAATVGFHDGKCYMTVGSDRNPSGAYRTELFVLESRYDTGGGWLDGIYDNITCIIYPNGSIYSAQSTSGHSLQNLSISPTYILTINVTTLTEPVKRYNESASSDAYALYTVGESNADTTYVVNIFADVNGTKMQTFRIKANSTGYIKYNTTGYGYDRWTEIKPATEAPGTLVTISVLGAVLFGGGWAIRRWVRKS